MVNVDNWSQWKKFAVGKRVVKIQIDEHDIWTNSKDFKTHREYITEVFKSRGLVVTRWKHEYSGDGTVLKWGLVYARADTDIRSIVEVCGIVGENLSERTDDGSHTS